MDNKIMNIKEAYEMMKRGQINDPKHEAKIRQQYYIDELYQQIKKKIFGDGIEFQPKLYGEQFDESDTKAMVVAAYLLNDQQRMVNLVKE